MRGGRFLRPFPLLCTILLASMRIPFCLGILFTLAILQPAAAQDCNSNGVDDATDIAGGTSLDCNSDGVPDECQVVPPEEIAKLTASDEDHDWFGHSVSISDNTSFGAARCG